MHGRKTLHARYNVRSAVVHSPRQLLLPGSDSVHPRTPTNNPLQRYGYLAIPNLRTGSNLSRSAFVYTCSVPSHPDHFSGYRYTPDITQDVSPYPDLVPMLSYRLAYTVLPHRNWSLHPYRKSADRQRKVFPPSTARSHDRNHHWFRWSHHAIPAILYNLHRRIDPFLHAAACASMPVQKAGYLLRPLSVRTVLPYLMSHWFPLLSTLSCLHPDPQFPLSPLSLLLVPAWKSLSVFPVLQHPVLSASMLSLAFRYLSFPTKQDPASAAFPLPLVVCQDLP